MKILCDVHIPYKLVRMFHDKGIEAEHINNILNRWHTSDADICTYADEHDFIVLSKDVDFRNSYFLSRTPGKLIRIQLGNIPNTELLKIIEKNLDIFIKCFDEGSCYIEINRDGVTIISASE